MDMLQETESYQVNIPERQILTGKSACLSSDWGIFYGSL